MMTQVSAADLKSVFLRSHVRLYFCLYLIVDSRRPSKEEIHSLRAFLLLLVKQLVLKVGCKSMAELERMKCMTVFILLFEVLL